MSAHSTRSNSASTQSTTPPTPPSNAYKGSRTSGRRLRKSTTPMKSVDKVEQHEKVTVLQGPSPLTVPTSSPSDITPSSSGTTTPAKQETTTVGSLRLPLSLTTPISSGPTASSHPVVKKSKRIPYTLVEASKGKKCPTPGCNGMGHATGLYTMHYAESGCPIAAEKRKEMDKKSGLHLPPPSSKPKRHIGRRRRRRHGFAISSHTKPVTTEHKTESSDTTDMESDSTLTTPIKQSSSELVGVDVEEILSSLPPPSGGGVLGKRKRIPYTLVEANKGNRCPTEGCNGLGHITGLYAMHYAVSGCPLAHGKTPEECKARRDEMNKAKLSGGVIIADEEVMDTTSADSLFIPPQPRKTPRLQATRNLSVSLENITGTSPTTMTSQLSRHSTHNKGYSLMLPRTQEHHYLPEPNLEGVASTQDLVLFREAQKKMNEKLGVNPNKKEYQLSKITFGSYEIDTWYPSPYSPYYTQLPHIYICEFCLKYFKSQPILDRHELKCSKRRPHPPGREIYRKYKYSVFEVDGEDNKEYCQNLCLLAKLFLDHKTLYFEVEPFLFYILTEYDSTGCHLIGYFSKEKHSAQGYNVSCILTLPHYMRKGFGRMLIDFSYLLSRLEEKVGSPERPLSDLGLVSYRSYWKDVILTYILKNSQKNAQISIREMSQEMGVSCEDIISTLQYFSLLKYWKSKHIIIKKKDLLEEHSQKLEERKNSPLTIDPSLLKWTPTTYPTYS